MPIGPEGAFAPEVVRVRRRATFTVDDYVDGVLSGDRTMLGRTITVIESRNARHQEIGQEILLRLLNHIRGIPHRCSRGRKKYVHRGVRLQSDAIGS